MGLERAEKERAAQVAELAATLILLWRQPCQQRRGKRQDDRNVWSAIHRLGVPPYMATVPGTVPYAEMARRGAYLYKTMNLRDAFNYATLGVFL